MFINTIAVGPLEPAAFWVTGGTTVAMALRAAVSCLRLEWRVRVCESGRRKRKRAWEDEDMATDRLVQNLREKSKIG